MKNLGYLFWAYNLVWLGICLYLVRMTLIQRRIQDRIDRIRKGLDGDRKP